MTNAERQARWRARHKAEIAALKARATAAVPEVDALRQELAQSQAKIRALQVQVEELKRGAARKPRAKPSRAMDNAILRCLHPDQRRNATDADKDEACRLYIEWKRDADNGRYVTGCVT